MVDGSRQVGGWLHAHRPICPAWRSQLLHMTCMLPPSIRSMYETWLITELCDRGSLAGLISGSKLPGDPTQREIWVLLCLLDIAQVGAASCSGGAGRAAVCCHVPLLMSDVAGRQQPQQESEKPEEPGPCWHAGTSCGVRRSDRMAANLPRPSFCQGLGYLHTNNIVHGDLKPGNASARGLLRCGCLLSSSAPAAGAPDGAAGRVLLQAASCID